MNSITRKWQYYSYKEIEKKHRKIMVNVKNMAWKIVFSNVEKISFYIPIYDNTQFILQSPIFYKNKLGIDLCALDSYNRYADLKINRRGTYSAIFSSVPFVKNIVRFLFYGALNAHIPLD